MQWWMNDYIHKVNILTPRWREVGVGAAIDRESGQMVFVTVFSAGQNAKGAVVSQSTTTTGSAGIAALAVPSEGLDHVVRAGDTLLAIGIRYGMDYNTIADTNGLTEYSVLQIGQVLRIPGSGVPSAGMNTGVGGPSSIPTVDYVVEAGDTLVFIAARHGMEWQDLARMNGLSEFSILQIGQVLQVPDDDSSALSQTEDVEELASDNESSAPTENDADSSNTPVLHVVVSGDTLFDIAFSYGIPLTRLYAINGLSESSVLQLGQVLRLN